MKTFLIKTYDAQFNIVNIEIPYVKIIEHIGNKFALHKTVGKANDKWSISEYTTGMLCCKGRTKESTLKFFIDGCPAKEEIEKRIKHYGKIN